MFVIDYGIDWTVKGKSGCDKGCIKYDFSRGEKTLVFGEAYTGCCEPDRVHMWVSLLVGHVHTPIALSTGYVPIERFIFVEDYFLISFGVEGVS